MFFSKIGSHDRTVCFHCGGGLKDWLPTDDAWRQHAAWYPLCVYVRFVLLTFANARIYECHQTGKEWTWCMPTSTKFFILSEIFVNCFFFQNTTHKL